jgi:F0F1-type ATP synthase assembly protein I
MWTEIKYSNSDQGTRNTTTEMRRRKLKHSFATKHKARQHTNKNQHTNNQQQQQQQQPTKRSVPHF